MPASLHQLDGRSTGEPDVLFLVEVSEQGLTAGRDHIMPTQYSTITSPMIERTAPT